MDQQKVYQKYNTNNTLIVHTLQYSIEWSKCCSYSIIFRSHPTSTPTPLSSPFLMDSIPCKLCISKLHYITHNLLTQAGVLNYLHYKKILLNHFSKEQNVKLYFLAHDRKLSYIQEAPTVCMLCAFVYTIRWRNFFNETVFIFICASIVESLDCLNTVNLSNRLLYQSILSISVRFIRVVEQSYNSIPFSLRFTVAYIAILWHPQCIC